MAVNNWVSLHAHSDHSRLDAVSKISELAEKAKNLGMSALALTDHGTISGWLKLFDECKKRGIKPIFGIEAYICDDATLISRTDKELEKLEIAKKEYLPLFDGIETV
jgi:DNA polymerase III alpha subunit